jgi:hypothetical protein
MWVTFMLRLLLLIKLIYFCILLKCYPLFPAFMMSMLSVMVPYVWPVLSTRREYPEWPVLFRMAGTSSLYLPVKACSIWPLYFSEQSKLFCW